MMVNNPNTFESKKESKRISKSKKAYCHFMEFMEEEGGEPCYDYKKNDCNLMCELKAEFCPLCQYYNYQRKFRPRKSTMRYTMIELIKKRAWINYLLEVLPDDQKSELEEMLKLDDDNEED